MILQRGSFIGRATAVSAVRYTQPPAARSFRARCHQCTDETYDKDVDTGSIGANMSEPWYENGLRFECTRCGHCCTGPSGYVWVNDEEIDQIAAYRGETFAAIKAAHTRAVWHKRSL